MNAIKSILFPTDFSGNANKALPYAADIARRSNALLYLLHIYNIPLMAPANMLTSREETMKAIETDLRNSARMDLENLVREYGVEDLQCVYLLNEGGVKEGIIHAIEDIRADLVVMGTRGANAEKKMFMGSVTKSIIQLSSAPILAVPEMPAFRPIHKIVYATDLEHDENNLLQYITEIAAFYKASVTALHIDLNSSAKEDNADFLDNTVDVPGYPGLNFKRLKGRDILKSLNEYLVAEEVDVLAMTTYTTSLIDKIIHKSLTRQMLLQTRVPLLAFVRKKYDTIFLG